MIRAMLLVSLAAAPVEAGPDRVSFLLGSHHVGASAAFDQVNPGVFLTWEDRALGLDYSAGAYRNSYGRGSIAATGAAPLIRWRGGEIAVFSGVAHYPGDGRNFIVSVGDFVPIGGVQIRHENAFVQIIPSDGQYVDAVVSFGLSFKLGEVN